MIFTSPLLAQLSPGKLATAHAEYEGIMNCTLCHVLGKGISDNKCLDCHEEIQVLRTKRRGYHGNSEIVSQACITCHSDHHGRDFSMVYFDEDQFDHRFTGYDLVGKHEAVDCRECHNDGNVVFGNIREKATTFLGLSTECVSCHLDVHQESLDEACLDCHTMEGFSSAPLFDHDNSVFPLHGEHRNADCASCHQSYADNDTEELIFQIESFQNCTDCHQDIHEGGLGNECLTCHSEWSFTFPQPGKDFNHYSSTGFSLNESHSTLSCSSCHDLGLPHNSIFMDLDGINSLDCVQCHEDVHDGKLGSGCAECHNESSFTGSLNTASFNHDLTDFPLEGRHELVDCGSCHTAQLTAPLSFNNCTDCHEDFHEEQFVEDDQVQDCSLCHDPNGFETTTYSFAQHDEARFPLTGAHLATPCSSCHLNGESWEFTDLPLECAGCHEDAHEDQMSQLVYSNGSCESCHTTDQWTTISFDHDLTDFELVGVHHQTDCVSCHAKSDEHPHGTFTDTPSSCSGCHYDVHQGQFDLVKNTDCAQCHDPTGWQIADFNHDRTLFPLDGKHSSLECRECHVPETRAGEYFVLYKISSYECADCHQ